MISIFSIKDKSMEPLFKEKGFVFVKRYLLFSPKTGDVVVLKSPTLQIPLLKRILKMNKDLIWVEGDNKNGSRDSRDFGWINKKNIQGKVISQISN